MKKYTFTFLFVLIIQLCFAQTNASWKGYFSYNEIKDVSQSTNKLFVASENALFSKDLVSESLKTTNTIDGLSGQTISTIYHSESSNKTLVGYENGLIIVINEKNGKMLYVVDIINKSIPANVKKVNHFMEYENIIYVSCDFGIVQYNLNTLQFGDTYFIGDGGALISVSQTAVFDGKIYAATLYNGIREADINNPNLNDYNQWTTIIGNGWNGITAFANNLYAITNFGSIQKLQGNSFVTVTNLSEAAVDFRSTENYLVITTPNDVYLYNTSLINILDIKNSQIPDITSKFSCATVINETVAIGTAEDGLITRDISQSTFENITPNGTYKNSIFAVDASTDNIWTVFGGYDVSYDPYRYVCCSPTQYAISKLTNKGWLTIPYNTLSNSKALSRIIINPRNSKEVFISSYYSGLLKLQNDEFSELYNAKNTGSDGLESIKGQVPDDVRVNGSAYDDLGNLWVTNSLVNKALKVFNANGTWKSYDLSVAYDELRIFNLGRLTIDKNNTKWIATQNDGLIAFNENYNNRIKTIKNGTEQGNLTVNDVRVAAIDHNDKMWIGTRDGLRVLNNVNSFLLPQQMTTEPIIILEDGLPQELLYQQFIMDIVVDGNNNKWIGTADSGVFMVSPNGQETFYHFTIDNSPLPSNIIYDIDINGKTGEVFIATSKGLVSFQGTATDSNENLDNVYVYPNPVKPGYEGTVKIRGLLDNANVQITDIQGNLVYETTSDGGTIEWDTTAFGKYKVASGVYMIFISSDDGTQTKTKKVMIIR